MKAEEVEEVVEENEDDEGGDKPKPKKTPD